MTETNKITVVYELTGEPDGDELGARRTTFESSLKRCTGYELLAMLEVQLKDVFEAMAHFHTESYGAKEAAVLSAEIIRRLAERCVKKTLQELLSKAEA